MLFIWKDGRVDDMPAPVQPRWQRIHGQTLHSLERTEFVLREYAHGDRCPIRPRGRAFVYVEEGVTSEEADRLAIQWGRAWCEGCCGVELAERKDRP